MVNDSNRIFGYDLIKTIAIFMIVFYHLGRVDYGEVIPGEYYLPNTAKFFSAILAASVPLFLMVNGAFIIPRNWTFLQTAIHALRLLFLYLFWKLLLQDLLCKGIFGIQEEMVHFWFLRTLAIIYLLVPFFAKYPICRKVLLTSLLIFPFLSNFIGDLVAYYGPGIILPSFAHSGFFTIYTFLFFYLGWILKKRIWLCWISIAVFLFGLVMVNFEVIAMSNYYGNVYDGVNAAFPTIGALALSAGLFQILKGMPSSSCSLDAIISFLGNKTLGIFMFHVPIIFIIRNMGGAFIANFGFVYTSIFAIIIMLVCAVLLWCIRKSHLCFLLRT